MMFILNWPLIICIVLDTIFHFDATLNAHHTKRYSM